MQNRNEKNSNAHGHDDVAVAVQFVGERAQLAGGLFVLEFDADGTFGGGGKKIEEILAIEADGDGLAFVFLLDVLLGFAVLRARRGKLDAFAIDAKFQAWER